MINKNIVDYIAQKAEEKHKGAGAVVYLIVKVEQEGHLDFSHENFENARQRAELVSFGDKHMADIAEYTILNHRVKVHGEKENLSRMEELESGLTDQEIELATRDFWNS